MKILAIYLSEVVCNTYFKKKYHTKNKMKHALWTMLWIKFDNFFLVWMFSKNLESKEVPDLKEQVSR